MKKQYIHIKNYKFRNINLIKKYKRIGDFFSYKPTNNLKKVSKKSQTRPQFVLSKTQNNLKKIS